MSIHVWKRSLVVYVGLLGTLVLTGCFSAHPDVVPVVGKVTVNGKAIANLIVIMQPVDGRASQGTTDSEGEYEMWYTADTKGAKVGTLSVWLDPHSSDMMEGESLTLFKTIPKQYFTAFQEVTVEAGGPNRFDFNITK